MSLVNFRSRLLEVMAVLAGHDDPRARAALADILTFPDDLPNLASRRPPRGNSRPQGIAQSYFAQRQRGRLPDFY